MKMDIIPSMKLDLGFIKLNLRLFKDIFIKMKFDEINESMLDNHSEWYGFNPNP